MMSAAQPEEAQKVFGLWSSMMEETMKAQQEMLKAWTPNEGGSETGSEGSSGSAQSSKPKSGER
jgi:ethanolamine ammonia-lyase large subunit